MKNYRQINNITGLLVFLFATGVYMLTAEPTGSFWDCGEFVSCAYKLQIAHSPGAPLFVMLAHLFTMLASGPAKVALMVNYYSAIMGGLCALLTFWAGTALGKKILASKGIELKLDQIIAIMGCGIVAALATTFSDSNWFSAVEGEVYASSSFFTALVFWAILKWDEHADEPFADRWLVFIAYMMGLSIGVHLLNLLTIPALVFVYYFRKTENITRWGVIKTFLIAVGLLGFVQYGVIPGLPKLALKFDILFVNSFGLPFNSGSIFFALLVIGLIVYGFYYSYKKANYMLNTGLLMLTVIIIGYSSYAMVLIRANANPSINMSEPKNLINLVSYLDREQYGDRPLLYGQYFTAGVTDVDFENGDTKYYQGDKKYEVIGHKLIVTYDPAQETIFPRIYDGDDKSHVQFYKDYLSLKDGETPTFGDNMAFFFKYQLGWMYWRYFLWNFAGRQNDIQGQGNHEEGNWISGVSFIDNALLGDQDSLPANLKNNPAKNKFFFLPLILGIIGLVYQFKRKERDGWIVMMLFFFTGVAIVLYLNQTPLQPRERDYAYAGSVYAFTFWIGLGVLAVWDWISKRVKGVAGAALAVVLCLLAPVIMGQQGWDDHDRSNRYTARDFGKDYLESCAPNAILFTQGDNDTYPLWYAQEVEGIRPDVRIVNLSLLGVDWYIDGLKRAVNESAAVPMTLSSDKYRGSTRDILRYYQNPNIPQDQYYNIKDVMDFISSDDPKKQTTAYGDMASYLPAKNIYIPVDKKYCIENGIVTAGDTSRILSQLNFTLPGKTILKPDMMVLDIIAANQWKRPIYFAISVASDAYLGMQDYFQQEGLTYRLVPMKKKISDGYPGGVQTDLMYNNMMTKFAFGGMETGKVYIDENIRRMTNNLQSNFARLASALAGEGKKDSALKVLNYCEKMMPESDVPVTYYKIPLAQAWYKTGDMDGANKLTQKLFDTFTGYLAYYSKLSTGDRNNVQQQVNENVYFLDRMRVMMEQANQKENPLYKKITDALNQYGPMYVAPQQ